MTSSQRNRRFAVNWPIQYRRMSEAEWRRGLIVNMSVSGVLFEAAEALPTSDPVELSILFQSPGTPSGASVVTTSGYVVRSEANSPPRVAVKFSPAARR